MRTKQAQHVTAERIHSLRQAKHVLDEERARKGALEKSVRPFASQRRPGHANVAWALLKPTRSVETPLHRLPDDGPRDPAAYLAAQRLEDDHAVEGVMAIVAIAF